MLDLDALHAAAEATGTKVLLDTTQAVGWPARHALGLANRFRAGADLEPGHSAIVSLAVADGTPAAMAAARIVGSARAGRLRLSFHISTSEADVDRAIDILRPHILPGHLAPR